MCGWFVCEIRRRAGHLLGVKAVPPAEEQVFHALFERHYPAVYTYARRRVGDDLASDIASEVFVIAWRRRAVVPREPLPWLYGVARRVIANQRRSAERMSRLVERVSVSAGLDADDAGADIERVVTDSSVIAAALAQLTEDEREVLALVAWEGLTARQLARVLDCSVPAATMRLHRARRRLQLRLRSESEE